MKKKRILFSNDLSIENPNNLHIIITMNKSVYQGAIFKVNIQISILFYKSATVKEMQEWQHYHSGIRVSTVFCQ